MERFLPNGLDVRTVSPLTLAYLGDGVYELLMRESMVNGGNCRPKDLHRVTAGRVCAKAQAAAVKRIQDQLTEEEQTILGKYYKCKEQVPAVAAALHISQEEVQNALYRVKEKTGLDVNDTEDNFKLNFVMIAKRVLEKEKKRR